LLFLDAEAHGVVYGDAVDDPGCSGCADQCVGTSDAVHCGVVTVALAHMVYQVDGAVSVSGQLAQHGNDDLHLHVGVFVDCVNADEGVNDDAADVVLLDLGCHQIEQRVVGDNAVPTFCRQGDLDVVFPVDEQPACQVFVADVVVLHQRRQAQVHLCSGVF
jgi:hypothetical protein